jgi:PAS domain S-box-containing protein
MAKASDSGQSGRDAGDGDLPSQNAVTAAPVPLDSILCTEELRRRPSRPPDYEKENRALRALAHALADSPRTILQTLADTILEVCDSDSAGISLLTTHDGGKRFYWPAIAGTWKPHIGGGTPRDFGPCGDVLDRNIPLLMRHIEWRYTYFQPVTPPVEEVLLVPFYVEGKAVGTIWAVAHDDRRKFDTEDERVMHSLGDFASSAYQILASLDALTSHQRTTSLLAAIVSSSEDAIITKDLDGVITSWNEGAERMFGYTAEEAVGRHITLIIPPHLREEEATILERLRRGERIEHFETFRMQKNGTLLDISLTISPIKDASGRVVGASKVARDVSERKKTEEILIQSHANLERMVEQRTRALRALYASLHRAQDNERRRIARELHDSVGQYLASLKMNLTTLNDSGQQSSPSPVLSECLAAVDQCISETRTISYLLHPPLLDEAGLSSAVRWYVDGFAERSGIRTELDFPPDLERLPDSIELALFRLLQESLTNIHRHSRSPAAAIKLSLEGDQVVFTVRDFGRGIPPERLERFRDTGTSTGVGLGGMRERIAELDGNLQVESNGQGTVLTATIPLKRPVSVTSIQSTSAA